MKSEESLHLIDILILFSSKFDTVFLKIYFISWEYVALQHSALQPFWHQGAVLCKTIFPRSGEGGWVGGWKMRRHSSPEGMHSCENLMLLLIWRRRSSGSNASDGGRL